MNEPDDTACAPLSVDRFRAELEVFSGPMDLLLHLVRQEEVDILEISVARITDRYLTAVRAMEAFDINVAAEFLIVAATLMEIKSRTLLPSDPDGEEEEEDPGMELVRRLLEYKEFREAAEHLGERADEQADRFPRPRPQTEAPEENDPSPEALLEDLAVWDLMAAFAELIRETQFDRPTTRIIRNDVPVGVYIDEVLERLRTSRSPVAFSAFFRRDRSRERIIGVFLALLELIRQGRIAVEQAEGIFEVRARSAQGDEQDG